MNVLFSRRLVALAASSLDLDLFNLSRHYCELDEDFS